MPSTLCPIPYILYPKPYALYPLAYTLYPMHYLLDQPYTLNLIMPTPSTLNPQPCLDQAIQTIRDGGMSPKQTAVRCDADTVVVDV